MPDVDSDRKDTLQLNPPEPDTRAGNTRHTAVRSRRPQLTWSGNQNVQKLAGGLAAPQRSAPESSLQMQARDPSSPPAQDQSSMASLLVDDNAATLAPGQMRKSDFLARLKPAVCQAADAALSGTIWSAVGCPYIERWFAYYEGQSSAHIERALRRFAPETRGATMAAAYIPIITARVRQGVTTWAQTGETPDVPADVPAIPPPAEGGLLGGIVSTIGSLFRKERSDAQPPAMDPQTVQSRLRGGQSLDGRLRTSMGRTLGTDLSGVRVHTGVTAGRLADDMDARAFTVGQDIAFASGEYRPGTPVGDALLAHELAHVAQQANGARAGDAGDRALEADADNAAAVTVASLWLGGAQSIGAGALPRLKSGLRLQSCKRGRSRSSAALQNAYQGRTPWTAALAQQALDDYRGRSAADQATWFTTHYPGGTVNKILQAMPANQIGAGGAYNSTVQSILQRIQRREAIAFAGTLGLSSQAQMAQAQATMMTARNAAAARAALGSGSTPTPAQVSAQQSGQVASTSIAPQAATLSPADERTQNAAATRAVTTFVTWATANHRALNIQSSDFRVDSRAVFNRGQNVLAFAESRKVVVGHAFAQAVQANPAYAMPTVIHELRGHEQYGPYGTAGSEYGLELYDLAAARMSGYTQPTGAGRTSEIDAYAYQETEIYSLMISVPYHTPLAAAHSSLSSVTYNPSTLISSRIGIIKNQWESRVARSLLRGLYVRLKNDPRVPPQGLRAFEQGIRNNFTRTEAAAILR